MSRINTLSEVNTCWVDLGIEEPRGIILGPSVMAS